MTPNPGRTGRPIASIALHAYLDTFCLYMIVYTPGIYLIIYIIFIYCKFSDVLLSLFHSHVRSIPMTYFNDYRFIISYSSWLLNKDYIFLVLNLSILSVLNIIYLFYDIISHFLLYIKKLIN